MGFFHALYWRLSIAIFCVLLLGQGEAAASPWGQESGRIFLSSRIGYFAAHDSGFRRLDNDVYVEVGLPAGLTAGGKVLYGTSWEQNADGDASASGVSETELFLQKRLLGGGLEVMSARLTAARPARLSSGVREGLAADGYDTKFSVLAGKTFTIDPVKVYGGIDVGYRRRWSDSADTLDANVTVGLEPSGKFLVLLEAYSTTSLRNANGPGADYDLIKLQPSLVLSAGRWSIQGGATFETAERNVVAGMTLFLSLWSRF